MVRDRRLNRRQLKQARERKWVLVWLNGCWVRIRRKDIGVEYGPHYVTFVEAR